MARLTGAARRQANLFATKKSLPGNLPKPVRHAVRSIKGRLTSTKRKLVLKNPRIPFDPKHLSFEELYERMKESELSGRPLELREAIRETIIRTTKADIQYAWIFELQPEGGYTVPKERFFAKIQSMVAKKKTPQLKLKLLNMIRADLNKRLGIFESINKKAYKITFGNDLIEVPVSTEQFRHTTIRLLSKMRERTNEALYFVNKMRRALGETN